MEGITLIILQASFHLQTMDIDRITKEDLEAVLAGGTLKVHGAGYKIRYKVDDLMGKGQFGLFVLDGDFGKYKMKRHPWFSDRSVQKKANYYPEELAALEARFGPVRRVRLQMGTYGSNDDLFELENP